MPKNRGSGQAATLTKAQVMKIRGAFGNDRHRLFWDIARYTGERWGAICRLLVSDVYRDAGERIPHSHVTFPANVRKKCGGVRETRQVPISDALGVCLRSYQPPSTGWLFPGKVPGLPVSFDAMDAALRAACDACGLVGVSTHSTRRTVATNLHDAGVSPLVIQQFFGWKDLKQVARYCDVEQDRVLAAVNLL